MKYCANPFEVEALIIKSVRPVTLQGTSLSMENGTTAVATLAMTARITPEAGDYLVTESDGYIYITPRAAFERDFTAQPSSGKTLFAARRA